MEDLGDEQDEPVRVMDAATMLDFKEITLPLEESHETTVFFAVQVPLHGDHHELVAWHDHHGDRDDDDGDGSLAARRSVPKATPDNPEHTAYLVGTILKLGSLSANVWFGWGEAFPDGGSVVGTAASNDRATSNNARRRMGAFVVAMPKRQYAGAFGTDSNSASKLIGSGSVHNDLVAINMSSRLSEKLQMAIFCSCNLDEGRPAAALGGETEMFMLQSRAAALAEKEIGRIVQQGSRNTTMG